MRRYEKRVHDDMARSLLVTEDHNKKEPPNGCLVRNPIGGFYPNVRDNSKFLSPAMPVETIGPILSLLPLS